MQQWEYLEVTIDLASRSWKHSGGKRGKLRKGLIAPALNEFGTAGWELIGTLRESGTIHRLVLKRPRIGGNTTEADLLDAVAASGSSDSGYR